MVKYFKLGLGKIIFIVYDFLGWVCEFKCFILGFYLLFYWICFGVINILNLLLKMYGDDYG